MIFLYLANLRLRVVLEVGRVEVIRLVPVAPKVLIDLLFKLSIKIDQINHGHHITLEVCIFIINDLNHIHEVFHANQAINVDIIKVKAKLVFVNMISFIESSHFFHNFFQRYLRVRELKILKNLAH